MQINCPALRHIRVALSWVCRGEGLPEGSHYGDPPGSLPSSRTQTQQPHRHPPTTTGTRILQIILSTPSKLQLHPMPMLGKNPGRETPPPRMQNLLEREGSSWNHSRNNPALPPFHIKGNHNVPGLHQVNKSSHTRVAPTERRRER